MKESIIKDDFYEVIPLKELKHFLRINGEHDDMLLRSLTKTAIQFAENFLETEILKKEIKATFVFKNKIVLKKPILEIISVKHGNEDISFKTEGKYLIPNVKIGSEIEIIYISGVEENHLKADLKAALMGHILSLYDLKNGGGKVPPFCLSIYNQYKNINF
jgi:hypothetical protein